MVGVGASAGGLDAFKRLLAALPDDAGIAYVLVQHLDPDHKSLMPGLLSRCTAMPVTQVGEPCTVEPDRVYIIPPNKFIRLSGNRLVLDEPVGKRGLRLPIDHFFRSLAEARAERAVCIVLSGTGADGTKGLQEVKAAGGLSIAQSPGSAEYDGMPGSAVSTGQVDFVVGIEEIPEILQDYARHPYAGGADGPVRLHESEPDQFQSIVDLLKAHTDYDFRCYKRGTLDRRIQRRMGLRHLERLGDYLEALRDDPLEMRALFRDLLIGVTRFFREPEAWEVLEREVLRPLVARRQPDEPVRIWVPGCSTGEEAYSLAMLLQEQCDRQNKPLDFQVFATDLDDQAVSIARNGLYPADAAADIKPSRLKRFFREDGDRIHVSKKLRERCIFAVQNVISDPPFSNLDLISCRNVMIYLEPEVQATLTRLFHFALAEGGCLFVGNSESVTRGGSFFEPVSKTWRIYRRRDREDSGEPPIPSPPGGRTTGQPRSPLAPSSGSAPLTTVEFARKTLLDRFAPASVLVDDKHEARYFHGKLKDYLELPAGEPSTDLFEMLATGLAGRVRGLLREAKVEERTVRGVVPDFSRGDETTAVEVTVAPLEPNQQRRYFLISFREAPAGEDAPPPEAPATGGRTRKGRGGTESAREAYARQLEYELQATREDLQGTIEELEASNEELKAAHEEATSMNEELQSANEELETSREELQSLNEELSTVNNQLEDKVDELESINNDLSNLLASTDTATIFLDTDCRIRRFTPACTDLLHLIPGDVGRPISDLSARVNDGDLLPDIRQVLRRLAPVERELCGVGGRTFVRRVLPFRTSENRIEGVVVTFTDISQTREAHRKVEVRERQQAAVATLGREALAATRLEPLFTKAVTSLAETLDVPLTKILRLEESKRELLLVAGVGWDEDIIAGQSTVPAGVDSQAGFTLQSSGPVVVADLAREKRFRGPRLLVDHGVVSGMSVIIGPESDPWGVLGIHTRERREFTVDDVNFLQAVANLLSEAIRRNRNSRVRRDRERRLELVTDAMPVLIAFCDQDMVYRFCNARYEEWFGLKREELLGRTLAEVIGEEAFEAVEPHVRRALAGEEVRLETLLKYRHGPPRHVRIEYIPHFNEKAEVEGYYAMITDISDRIRITEAQERLAAIVEHSHDAIIGKDLEGTITSWNRAAERIYGYTAAEMIGKSIQTIIPEDRQAEFRDIMEQIRRGEPVDQLETVRVRKDGQLVEVLVTVSPIPGADGSVVGGASITHDMTGLRRAEQAVLDGMERLRIARDAAKLGIHDYNVRTGEVIWDSTVRDLWGVPDDEPVTFETFMEGLHPDDREATQAAVNRALDPDGDGEYAAEYRVLHRADGQTRWVAATGQVDFEDGEPVRLVGTVQDITARKTAELELEEWTDRLEERVAERTAVAEQRAADLRALAAQITDAEQRARRQLAGALHDDLQQILAAAKMRLPAKGEMASGEEMAAVASLLDDGLAKTRSLIAELSPPVLHEGTLSDAFKWLARHMKGVHGFTVELEVEEDLGEMDESGRTMLFNAVRELLFNAVKHSGVGEARVEATRKDGTLRIRVTDHGNGFDPELARRSEGGGFGLFNIRERIDAYGGSLEIDSEPGQGAHFILTVPLQAPARPKRPLLHPPGNDRDQFRRTGGPEVVRVLIADDHKLMRDGLRQILEDTREFEIVGEAADGREAVHLAAAKRPDVIIMDISMPGINGIEATREIVEHHPDIRVIGLSLHERHGLGSTILEAGASAFLQKDSASTDLLDTIRNCCRVVN